MIILLIAFLLISLIGSIRSKDIPNAVIAVLGIILWIANCTGMITITSSCLTR